MAAGDFQAAALAIYSLKQYGPDADKREHRCSHREGGEVAREREAGHDSGSRVPLARPRMGKRVARNHQERGARSCLAAACRWRVEPAARDGLGFVCDGSGTLCAERSRQDGGVQSRLSERRRLSAAHAGARRIVACRDARHMVAAVLRKRIPVWARSVHICRRNGMGGHGADTSCTAARANRKRLGNLARILHPSEQSAE